MKKLIVSAALLLSVLAASQSEARSLQTALSANLTKFDFQNASALADRRIRSGTINVDLKNRILNLKLTPSFYCPPQMMCAQVMPRTISYELAGMEISTGSCGQTIYTALEDARPVDGNLTKLTVVDNRTNTCKYFAPISSTEITLELTGGRSFESSGATELHQFEAELLN